jgi:signal transduction histidine kinase
MAVSGERTTAASGRDHAGAGASRGAALRSILLGRSGFWRALAELSLLINSVTLLGYALDGVLASPWKELISYLSLTLYGYAAWRLEPGAGGLGRRIGRVALWLLLLVLVNGTIGWLIFTNVPMKTSFLGMQFDELQLGFGSYLGSAGVIIGGLFLTVRLPLVAWGLGARRLRWRLVYSYLLVGILTLFFVPIGLLLFLAIASLFVVPTTLPPTDAAPVLARAIAPAVEGSPPEALEALLAGVLDGTTRLPVEGEELDSLPDLSSASLRRLTLLRPDGQVIASAGESPFTAAQPLPAEAGLGILTAAAGVTEACAEGRPALSLLADSVVCAVGEGPSALLLLETRVDSSAQIGAAFGRVVGLTLLGTSVLLNIAALVVVGLLPVALGVGYFLARQLTRRIERLTEATAGVATGDLSRRVAVDSEDEIGRLGEDFNRMAGQLAERERALADAAARAEALLRANRRLVADVSHELRNPLATLRGYLEALEQEHGQQLPPDDMRVIRGEMGRLTALVDDLFTLARAEAQQLPLSVGPVDAGALVGRLAAALAPLARREREIELVAQIDPATPPARADAARLEQVVRNLAQNALRHTLPGGIIAFEVAPAPGGAVTIAVADTGVGIEPEDLPHVFERFFRGDSSRARETGGAGLGLSLVRELVGAMGGSVAVESTPGRGSRFTVTLQAA